MNIIKNTIKAALILAVVVLASCSKDEIEPWGDDALVWFPQENVNFTFATHPEVADGESYMVAVPLRVAAKVSNRDRMVNVEVTRQPEDSRTKYEIQNPVVFHAGNINDTVWVKVTNSSHLSTVHDTVRIAVRPSADFQPGLPGNLECNLCLFNGLEKPTWWNANTDYYMGYFSQQKMQVYLQVIGSDEMPYDPAEGYAGNKFLFNRYRLREYVSKNPIFYPADDPVAPGKPVTFNSNSY